MDSQDITDTPKPRWLSGNSFVVLFNKYRLRCEAREVACSSQGVARDFRLRGIGISPNATACKNPLATGEDGRP